MDLDTISNKEDVDTVAETVVFTIDDVQILADTVVYLIGEVDRLSSEMEGV